VDLLPIALECFLLLDKSQDWIGRVWVAQGSVAYQIIVDGAHLDRDAAIETRVHHLTHLFQALPEKDTAHVELDPGCLEPIELVQHGLHRLSRTRDRCHPIDRDVECVQSGLLEVAQEVARQKEAIARQAEFIKAEGFGMAHELDDVWMLQRLTSLQAEPGDAELSNFVHPPFEVGRRGVRKGIIVLVTIVTVEVALFCDVEVGGPWLPIEYPHYWLDVKQRLLCTYCPFAGMGQAFSFCSRRRFRCRAGVSPAMALELKIGSTEILQR
jgi:hypothetical protein